MFRSASISEQPDQDTCSLLSEKYLSCQITLGLWLQQYLIANSESRYCPYNKLATVVPTRSDSYVLFCLQFLSKTLTFSLHLGCRESIDNLCINPILYTSDLSIISP